MGLYVLSWHAAILDVHGLAPMSVTILYGGHIVGVVRFWKLDNFLRDVGFIRGTRGCLVLPTILLFLIS